MITVLSDWRKVWKNEGADQTVMHYFQLVETHNYGLLPFVFYILVHFEFDKMKRLLETTSHNSLLNRREKFWKLVRLLNFILEVLVIYKLQLFNH